MERLKFHQKMPVCLFTVLSFCLLVFCLYDLFALLSSIIHLCLLLWRFCLFICTFYPFCHFSLLGFVSATSSKCLKYLDFAQYIWHVQCNLSCSQYTSRCECIFHDIEKERNREGEKQSWRLHWELRAIVALSCPESTFDNNSHIFKALL